MHIYSAYINISLVGTFNNFSELLLNILDFSGKRIFITGASSGIGKELALQYAQKGAK